MSVVPQLQLQKRSMITPEACTPVIINTHIHTYILTYIRTCTCTSFNLEFRVAEDKLQCGTCIFKLQDKNSIVINATKIVKLITTF